VAAVSDDELLVVAAWRLPPGPPPPAGWRAEAVLADQSALDRAGSKGRTPPPFHALLWQRPGGTSLLEPPPELAADLDRWAALRLRRRPAWDDTTATGVRPQLKQVSFVTARPELSADEFARHYREHVDVARVHHPAIVRYAQHEVLAAAGDPALHVDGVSELWFADEESLVTAWPSFGPTTASTSTSRPRCPCWCTPPTPPAPGERRHRDAARRVPQLLHPRIAARAGPGRRGG
jgi:hypothetical protein